MSRTNFLSTFKAWTRKSAARPRGHKQCKNSECEESPSPGQPRWNQFARVVGGPTHWAECMSRLGLFVLQYIIRSDPDSRSELHGNMVYWHIWQPDRCWVGRDELGSHPGWAYPQPRQQCDHANASLTDANPVFQAAHIEMVKLYKRFEDEMLHCGTRRLQELGWVFWEDRSRISTLRLPLDGDDQRRAMFHLDDIFYVDKCRDVPCEIMGFLPQVEGSHVANEHWNSIIVPKYGLRPLGLLGAPPRSKTPWLDVW